MRVFWAIAGQRCGAVLFFPFGEKRGFLGLVTVVFGVGRQVGFGPSGQEQRDEKETQGVMTVSRVDRSYLWQLEVKALCRQNRLGFLASVEKKRSR